MIIMNILIIIAVIVIVVLLVPTIYAGLIGAPLVFTPKKAIREAFEKAQIKKGGKLYELGCGTGRILLIAEKEFNLQTVGFELSPIIYWIAKLNLYLNSSKKSQVKRLNAYNQSLSDADAVFCFLNIEPMKMLKEKFERELMPGAIVVSYSFSIKGWTPVEIIEGYPGKVYVYKIESKYEK